MSVLTPKRVVLFAAAALLAASAFANNPSPRTAARMAFDEKAGVGVLFGGRGAFDGATQLVHDTDETWYWIGTRFVQRFPETKPPARNSHSMVYDTKRQRIVMFGGRQETSTFQGDATILNDTWIFQNDNWAQLAPATSPTPRHNSSMAYDIVNDRIVLFGGTVIDTEGAPKPVYDTWEFDGTTWAQVGANGQPQVAKPVLAYDAERKQVLLMGLDASATTLPAVMYRYDATAKTWTKVTPEKMPPCVNEGYMVFQRSNKKVAWLGGICGSDTNQLDEVWEWDGTNWTKVTITNATIRAYSQAVAYDTERDEIVMFGGSDLGTTNVRSSDVTYARGAWRFPGTLTRPVPRSLSGFQTDPVSGNIWLYGGLFENSSGFLDDFWGYRNQQWFPITTTDGPSTCSTPLTAFDVDRSRLVVTCLGSSVTEWDSTAFAWKPITLTKLPDPRRFANMVYDRKLKKTVMFGGYSANGNYLNETWTWDGSAWTQVKTKTSEAPNNRGLMAMWYDPQLEKTVLYGGLGRANINQSVTRYSDMWSFDGTKWTKLNVSQTPGQRLGAQIAVDPVTGKLLLFGGLLARSTDNQTQTLTQEYANDTWLWDGKTSTWTELHPQRSPDARENGMMAYDPLTHRIVLFGGYSAGFYHSDLWTWTGDNWVPLLDQATRRRTAGSPTTPAPAPSGD
ncbi:MAG TPA: kelch repeat-containing protein [Thermoanaerobaculia bacterium]|nr:kelch repeat-containing protein [Thermoanaerobaculia bacterium]